MDKLSAKLIKIIILVISLTGLFFIVKYTLPYIYPFAIALFLSYLLHPLITYLQKRLKLARSLATLIVITCFFVAFFTVTILFAQFLFQETREIIEKIIANEEKFTSYLTEIQGKLLTFYENVALYIPLLPTADNLDIPSYIALLGDFFISSSTTFFATIFQGTSLLLSSLTHIGLISMFMLIIVYFMTKDMPKIIQAIQKYTPEKLKVKIQEFVIQFKKSVWGFMKAQIMITFISSVIICIGLFLMKVEHFLTITWIVFLIDFIPYIGIGVLFIPWMLFSFLTMQYGLTIQLASLYAIVIIIRQVVEPKIVASHIGIHPFIAVSILFIGFQAFGIIGMLLTPLIIICLSALYHIRFFHLLLHYLKHHF